MGCAVERARPNDIELLLWTTMRGEIVRLEEAIRVAENAEVVEQWRLDLEQMKSKFCERFPGDPHCNGARSRI
jgi:hypothetical protein